ncbi:MAG: flagellar motor switch protein FliG [Defluviitaleaceae bacterium]|nr:flagellar motor switch protein FliG [Defluviitaleaceae bacterium]
MKTSIEELTGREKAAILLITLGPEKSSEVFKHFREDEIETVTLEIANTVAILPETKNAVLEEFYQVCLAQDYITEGGVGYAKQILESALGQEKAFDIISKMTTSLQVRPFDFIRKAEAGQILNFIQNEHPQTIALILSYLKPTQAAQILAELSPERQSDVTRRIALMNQTSPDVIKEVEKALENKLSKLMLESYTTVGGVDSVVEILSSVDRGTEKNIMDTLETEDFDLSEEIRKRMFVFEDIMNLSNKDIQTILRQDIDNKDLAIALKGSTAEVQDLILSNVSKRLAVMIREDMEFMGPVRRSDVEESQQRIVNVIRRLQEAGDIIVSRGGGDDLIV